MAVADPFDLDRFVTAQAPTYDRALAELEAGWKRTHWMWFIFPQLRGLGHSAMAGLYGIGSLDEARAYLTHPLLGPRLERCTRAVLAAEGRSAREIFDTPDDMKFGSSMTLFALAGAEADDNPFRTALDRYCGGVMDEPTVALLRRAGAI